MGGCSEGECGALNTQMFQAAILQLAPLNMTAQCRSPTCCWRWAAHVILDEFDQEHRLAEGLRTTLDEELGHSVRNQLVDLEQKHEELLYKYREAVEEVKSLTKRHSCLERELLDAQEGRAQAEDALHEAERLHRQDMYRAEASDAELKAQLAQAQQRPGAAQLEEMLKADKAVAAGLQGQVEKAEAEALKVGMARTDLEWQLQQAKALLAKRSLKRRRKKTK